MKKILSYPSAYRLFFSVVGGDHIYDTLVHAYVPKDMVVNVLDVGCGPAHILPWLVDSHYTGIDISEAYIKSAREEFGDRGKFVCGDVNVVDIETAPYDIVFACGLLHHLSDDEVIRMSKRVRELLKPGGKFITFDGCYIEPQSSIAKFILSHDRGKHVRKYEEYLRLVEPQFKSVTPTVRHDLLRIPYTHLIMECKI